MLHAFAFTLILLAVGATACDCVVAAGLLFSVGLFLFTL
jgi:hypothetical protein